MRATAAKLKPLPLIGEGAGCRTVSDVQYSSRLKRRSFHGVGSHSPAPFTMRFPKYMHSFEVVAEIPAALEGLRRLAHNLHWSWSHLARDLFREVDKNLWEEVEHNPIQLLERTTGERLLRLSEDEGFLARLKMAEEELRNYLSAPSWFGERRSQASDRDVIAYFCAEFGINEALPIYSGGLGVLAGDHLKAASDLGLPLVGVGLLYSRGYFRQSLGHDGWQQERYPQYDFYKMPIQLVRGEDGQPKRIEVELPDRTIICQIWKAEVGRVSLFLLDSNVLENAEIDQGITDTLYGGDQEMRIRQEIILGVGGMRALQAVGLRPVVCHMNEGHAAFLTLERILQVMAEYGCDFRTARKIVVSSNVFTTHTPVPAGFDLFPTDLLRRYVPKLLEPLQLSFEDFVRMGRIEKENEGESFNMAVLAMENANRVNGVSELHAKVTREMFHARWPGYPVNEVPVEAVTNGIHTMTWISRQMAELFDQYLGDAWRERPHDRSVWQGVYAIPDKDLWELRENMRGDFVRYVRKKLKTDMIRRGVSSQELQDAESVLDPRVLTIGFARRFATYKRATLMLSDRERLKALLYHADRPIQIVIAGKSHPRDDGGKTLIQDLYRFINNDGGRARMVFLEDYDMEVARRLVQGVDVWLNNPRRPHEASGTSGMKVVPNGGLNCSILDGWWDEGYQPSLGWAIGERRDDSDEGRQDWLDSHSLYHLLETEIAPKFYHRMSGGIPASWVEMMKRSIAELAPFFCTSRMVAQYGEQYYFPGWDAYFALTANDLERAKAAMQWRERVRTELPKVKVRNVRHSAEAHNILGSAITIEAEIDLNGLSASEVKVQALYGQVGSNRELIDPEVIDLEPTGEDRFAKTFALEQPGHRGFVIRIVPHHPDVVVPSEMSLVTWEG
jgi:starch phosphorylase